MKHEIKLKNNVKKECDTRIIELNDDCEFVVSVPEEFVKLIGIDDEDKYVEWNWNVSGNRVHYDIRVINEKTAYHPRYKNFHFNKEGAVIIGVLDSITPNMHPEHRGQNIYNIELENGEIYSVFGSYEIDKNISVNNIGQHISIEYLGKEFDKTGKYTKKFEVNTW